MDYSIVGILRDKILCQLYRSIDELTLAIQIAWDEIFQETINRIIDLWRPRLTAVIRNEGGHVEHEFR